MKIILSIFCIVIFAFNIFGQIKTKSVPKVENDQKKTEQCRFTLEDSPKVRGLKLGMSVSDVRDIFGKGFLPFETKEPNGIESVTLYDSFFQDLSAFDGVSRLTLKFYQWNLHQIEIKYAESAAQFTNEQLKTKVIEAFNLPPAKWEGSSFYFDTINEILTNTGQELACKDFSVEVVYGNQVRLTNFVTRKMIEENEQKKRENFKP